MGDARRGLVLLVAVALCAGLLPGCLVFPGDTSQIAFVSTSTVGNWRFDYYRNNAYRCAISGHQTFVVGTRLGSVATAPAPLWVWMHGDGAGWFDASGTPQPDSSWMNEESAASLRQRLTHEGLVTRLQRSPVGFRLLAVSYCDRDRYSGTGQTDVNNPNLEGSAVHETNGLQATKAAIQYVQAQYATSKYFLSGGGSGSAGAYYAAFALQLQGIPPAGVVGDGGLVNALQGMAAYSQGVCMNPEFAPAARDALAARVDPTVADSNNEIDRLVSRHELMVPLLHVWNHGDSATCGNAPMQCPLRDNTVVTMGATDCNHQPLAAAIAAQGPTSPSMNLPVCVDDDPVPDCSLRPVTTTSGLINTDPASPASYLTAIMNWVNRRLAVPGTLNTWGSNFFGQLGIGSASYRPVVAQVGSATGWASIANGQDHALAVRTDGTLWAWGLNGRGQLGDGTVTDRTVPTQIGTDTDWASVAAGESHTLAVKTNGTLWTWGGNFDGQLGDGTTTSRASPAQVGTSTNWLTVAAGGSSSFGLMTDGTLWAWGDNTSGKLGIDSIFALMRTVPTRVGTDADWASVSGGWFHTMAVKTNGTLWGWGSNSNGQLGTTPGPSPSQIGNETDWASVAAGSRFTVAIKASGTFWAWGQNTNGQLGDGTTTNRPAPTQIGTDADWFSVAAGETFTSAIKSDGSLWAWGSNTRGQLGDGTLTERHAPGRVGTDTDWSRAQAGNKFTAALKADGSLWTWGEDVAGELGDAVVTALPAPTQVGTATDWIAADGGSDFSTAIRADGSLWAWGNNSSGQLGDGSTTARFAPVRVGTDTDWASVSDGGSFTMALKSDGSLWAWGSNNKGQLGNGTTSSRTSPAQVGTSTDWAYVSAGFAQTLAVKTDGTLWAWGDNSCAQFGDGTTTSRITPVQIGADTNWTAVGAETQGTVGLRTDGTLWWWGHKCPGNTFTLPLTPASAGSRTDWAMIDSDSNHSMLIATDGSLWDEAVDDLAVFSVARVGSATGWESVAAGADPRAVMTMTDGTLWSWLGGAASQVGTTNNWVVAASGDQHSLAISSP